MIDLEQPGLNLDQHPPLPIAHAALQLSGLMSTDEPHVQQDDSECAQSVAPATSQAQTQTQERTESNGSSNSSGESVVVASTADGSVVVEAEEEDGGGGAASSSTSTVAIPSDAKAVLEPVDNVDSAARDAQNQDRKAGDASQDDDPSSSGRSDMQDINDPPVQNEANPSAAEDNVKMRDGTEHEDKPATTDSDTPIAAAAGAAGVESAAMQPSPSATSSTAATAGTGRATPPVSGSAAGSATGASPSKLAPPKKFTSSLSMNKKFLEKCV